QLIPGPVDHLRDRLAGTQPGQHGPQCNAAFNGTEFRPCSCHAGQRFYYERAMYYPAGVSATVQSVLARSPVSLNRNFTGQNPAPKPTRDIQVRISISW